MAGADTKPHISRPGLLAFGEYYSTETILSEFSKSECAIQVSTSNNKYTSNEGIIKHSAVACASGRVYTFGYARCHDWMKSESIDKPIMVSELKSVKVVQVACGYNSTFFLTNIGDLYSSGHCHAHQLGHGSVNWNPTKPYKIKLPRIIKVVCGLRHTVALTYDGYIYVCGCNKNGQLGLGDIQETDQFTQVSGFTDIVTDIACGSYHTVILTTSKSLYVTGQNNEKQLGIKGTTCRTFQCVGANIVSMACGTFHTIVLLSNNKALAMGANESGQLGIGQLSRSSAATEVLGLKGHSIVSVSAGFSHSAFLTDQGDVLVCGHGMTRELLQEKTKCLSIPTLIPKLPNLHVKQIEFGEFFSLFVVEKKQTLIQKNEITLEQQCAQYDEVRLHFTNLKRILLKCLECPVCFKPMQTTIRLCMNGHSICGSCHSQLSPSECPICRESFTPGKNMALQSLATELQIPCTECLLLILAADHEDHAIVCPNRQYSCPLAEDCEFRGRPEALLSHTLSNHPKQTWQELPLTFNHQLDSTEVCTDLLVAQNKVFVLVRTSTSEELRFTVALLGTPDDAKQFKFKLEFNPDGDDNRTIRRNVSSCVESKEVMSQTQNCASIKKDQLTNYCTSGNVTCKFQITDTHS